MDGFDESAWLRPLPPVYLQFMDRELSETVGSVLGSESIDSVVRTLSVGTDAPLYCGLSALFEHPSMVDRPSDVIDMLIQHGQLDLAGHHVGFDSFITSRQTLYSHDRERYPLYFREPTEGLEPTIIKRTSATSSLIATFEEMVDGPDRGSGAVFVPASGALRAIEHVLDLREEEAITASLFSRLRAPIPKSDIEQIRYLISTEYTRHQLDESGGVTTAGVRGFERFDRMIGTCPLWADVSVLDALLGELGLRDAIATAGADFWASFLSERPAGGLGRMLPALIFEAAEGVSTAVAPRVRRRAVVENCLRRLRQSDGELEGTTLMERVLSAGRLVASVVRPPEPAALLRAHDHPLAPREADVLLVTATEIEAVSLQRAIGRPGSIERRDGLTFTDYGLVGSNATWHTECAIGASTSGGALLTVAKAIRAVAPHTVLMPGICFGVRGEKTPVADLIVGDHLLDYSLVRASTSEDGRLELECRGDRVPASPGLVQLARALARGNERIHLGLMVSGPVLIDNVGFRDAVLAMPEARDALGGEMEGQGVFAAAYSEKVDWLVAKAVCDFADGNKGEGKKERQRSAAEASASFVVQMVGTL